MSIAASVKSVSPVARALTDGGRMVAFKSMFAPVTEVARSLQNPVQPNRLAFSVRVACESEDQVAEANEILVGADADAVDDQVAALVRSVNAMTFTARNVIIPTIDALVNQYLNRQSQAGQPNVSVNVFKYHDVHSEPALVNHVASKYTNVQPRPEYRTFILPTLNAESIVTLVSENNPHLEQSQVVEWLLLMGAERINAVWTKLYGSARLFDFSTASWMHPAAWPLQIDELLLAYCLTGALREQPQEVVGESVGLDEWERALGVLHELVGSKLLQAYNYRAQDTRNQRLIITSDAKDAMRTGVVAVLVNNDVSNGWVAQGGDIQALLGAAVFEPGLTTVPAINAVAEQLVSQWIDYYPILRQSCADNTLRNRRNDVVAVFLSSEIPAVEGLPAIDAGVAGQRLDAELRAMGDECYSKPFHLFAELVCRVYYPTQPLYVTFIQAMDRYAKVYPGASGRELAREAVFEIVASWLADQLTTVPFQADVDPNAVASQEDEGGANVLVEEDNEQVAENVGDVQPEAPINELAEAEAEGDTVEADSTLVENNAEPLVEGDAPVEGEEPAPVEGLDAPIEEEAEELEDGQQQ